jgi:hypothetical protein
MLIVNFCDDGECVAFVISLYKEAVRNFHAIVKLMVISETRKAEVHSQCILFLLSITK